MIKKIIKWILSAFLLVSAVYYGVCKIIKIENVFTNLIDNILKFVGIILNFIAQHIIAILIVLGLLGLLWCLYIFIVTHHNRKF